MLNRYHLLALPFALLAAAGASARAPTPDRCAALAARLDSASATLGQATATVSGDLDAALKAQERQREAADRQRAAAGTRDAAAALLDGFVPGAGMLAGLAARAGDKGARSGDPVPAPPEPAAMLRGLLAQSNAALGAGAAFRRFEEAGCRTGKGARP